MQSRNVRFQEEQERLRQPSYNYTDGKMADPSPPSISVIETAGVEGDGAGGREVKQSLESLLSRSDSASGDEEGEEPEATTLAVPSSVQGKTRETSRKGRKISVNASVKVGLS